MNNHWAEHGFGDWGVIEKESGRLIGFSGLHYVAYIDEVNIGYAFEKSKWRQGIGYEIGQAILDFGFRTLDLSEVVATIMPDNIASIKLAEKFGMSFWKRFTWGGTTHVAYSMTCENWDNVQETA
jgi:RimJ/RimL family protein N-acetyltransferase